MISVQPFENKHLPEAGQMFAAKYRVLQRENGLLPAAFQDEVTIQPMLERVVTEHPAAVALEGKRVVGYLTGFSRIPTLKCTASGVYVPVWGHCVSDPTNTRVYEALYTEMSAEWVHSRCHAQILSYFVPDEVLDGFLFSLGFGLLLIDGIRALSPLSVAGTAGIEFSEAGERDLAGLMRLDHQLAQHLRGAPSFLPRESMKSRRGFQLRPPAILHRPAG